MPIYYQTPNSYENGHTTNLRRPRPQGRQNNANDDYPNYRNKRPTQSSAGTNSNHTLHTGKLTSTYDKRPQRRNSTKVENKPVTITTYSPVFSVHYHRRYNERTGEYEVSHVTRTVQIEFAHRAREQVAASILCAKKTKEVVRSFSHDVDTRDWHITVQVPTETNMRTSSSKHSSSVPALMEPYLPDTQTIMCNSGWITEGRDGTAQKLLLAVPHYSYMWSRREFMIGSLQASIDHRHKRITIKAPTLMSREGNVYGCEDIGMKGICNYFYWHPSSRYVPDFVKPRQTQISHKKSPQNLVSGRGY